MMKRKKSWKTTLGGILSAVGVGLLGSPEAFPGAETVGTILAAVGSFLMGVSARDNKVTSEDANAD